MFMYLRSSTTKSRKIVQIKFEGIQDIRAHDQAQPNKAASTTEEVGEAPPGRDGHPPSRQEGG
jgi:hypothetical protein